jgi:hypothetical protein
MYPSVFLSVCLSLYPSIRLSVHLPTCLPACLSVHHSINQPPNQPFNEWMNEWMNESINYFSSVPPLLIFGHHSSFFTASLDVKFVWFITFSTVFSHFSSGCPHFLSSFRWPGH